jgi:hypothetical protein
MVDLQIWCVVENTTIVLTATIPTMGFTSQKSSTVVYSYDTWSPMTGHPGCGLTRPKPGGDSEEHILPSGGADARKITKTTDVSQFYELESRKQKAVDVVPASLEDNEPAKHSEG